MKSLGVQAHSGENGIRIVITRNSWIAITSDIWICHENPSSGGDEDRNLDFQL